MNKDALALATVTLVVGAIYVFQVPAGLPYDEPAHWSTVVYYADHMRLPVLGDRGTTYEAQQGPLSYTVDALAIRATHAIGASETFAFDVVRLLGVAELAVAIGGMYLLIRNDAPRLAAAGAILLLAANPMLLTMGASVQNDTLALALAVIAIYLAATRLGSKPRMSTALAVGVISGLAILAKLTAWLLLPAVIGWLLYQHGRKAVSAAAAVALACGAVCGWWFVRNLVLYDDLSASRAVSRVGVRFPKAHFSGGSLGHLAEEAVTYLWVPTEYLRNTISASAGVKGVVVLLTLWLIGAGLVRRRQVRFHRLLVVCALLALASWLVPYYTYQAFAPRLAYLALPLWAMLAAAALTAIPPRLVIAVAVAIVVALNAWTLEKMRHAPAPESPVIASCCLRGNAGGWGLLQRPVRNVWEADRRAVPSRSRRE